MCFYSGSFGFGFVFLFGLGFRSASGFQKWVSITNLKNVVCVCVYCFNWILKHVGCRFVLAKKTHVEKTHAEKSHAETTHGGGTHAGNTRVKRKHLLQTIHAECTHAESTYAEKSPIDRTHSGQHMLRNHAQFAW